MEICLACEEWQRNSRKECFFYNTFMLINFFDFSSLPNLIAKMELTKHTAHKYENGKCMCRIQYLLVITNKMTLCAGIKQKLELGQVYEGLSAYLMKISNGQK